MSKKPKDNSIKMAIGITLIGAFIGFLATNSLFGAFRGACGGFLIVLVSELYSFFKESSSNTSSGEL